MPLVPLLTALLSFLPRSLLAIWFRVRMLGARRQRRIAWRELLKPLGQRLHLSFEFANSLFVSRNECFNEVTSRFGFRRQFDTRFGLANTSIEPENIRPSLDQFSILSHWAVNGYTWETYD